VKWIGQISAHLAKTTDPEMVFIELLNEPGGLGMYGNTWQIYQDRLINEVRKSAPLHTLIVNAGGYMLWSDTIRHTPHPDRNVIYAVHYYEPGQFTHQGARWMKPMYQPLRNVPWPLTEANLQQAIDNIHRTGWKDKLADADKKAEAFLRNGVKEGFGTAAKMDETMGAVVEWAKQHDVRIVVNEFGVFKPYVKQEDRVRYLKDVTRAMERHGFGWTMWEYAHEFGFAEGAPGKRTYEADTLEALGLTAK
jgi:endoglucanase